MSTIGRLLRIKEVALILNVSRQTIWRWIEEGKIKATKLPSGRYRIPEGEVLAILHHD